MGSNGHPGLNRGHRRSSEHRRFTVGHRTGIGALLTNDPRAYPGVTYPLGDLFDEKLSDRNVI